MPFIESTKGLVGVYANRRMLVLLLLGFSSGLPLALTGDLLAAWLKDAGHDVATIGFLSLVALPYSLKFLWSPLMDRFAVPVLGRRRGWLLLTQLLLMAAILAMSASGQKPVIALVAATAAAVALLSASQDIVVDAYRADVLRDTERGAGAAVSVTGYRVAMIAGGAGALILAGSGHFSWPTIYRLAAGLMGIGIVATFVAPEPAAPSIPRSLRDAVVEPLRAFLLRPDGWLVMAFALVFKLPEYLASGPTTVVFLRELGFTNSAIGGVRQGLGVGLTIAGALCGGVVVARLGLWKSLWLFALLHSVSNLMFLLLARSGGSYPLMVGVIGVESLVIGLTTAGFMAFLMSRCDSRFSATQYALLSGLMALGKTIAGPASGVLAQHYGWPAFFAISATFGIPGVVLLPWLRNSTAGSAELPAFDNPTAPALVTKRAAA